MPTTRPHVLVVNDNALICDVTAQILKRHGYDVTMAEGGQQALDAIREHPPDLMILDIVMPDMDGVNVVTSMEEDVPFLIHSILPDDDPRVIRLMELGALGRVSPQTLLTDVSRVLDG